MDYFSLWERGHGPCQSALHQVRPLRELRGLGDLMAWVLKRSSLEALIRKMFLLFGWKTCGCRRRQEQLNQVFAVHSWLYFGGKKTPRRE